MTERNGRDNAIVRRVGLAIYSDKRDTQRAKLTSDISLSLGPIWNMLGVIDSRE